MQNGYRNARTGADGAAAAASPVTLLLVETDPRRAERMERHLAQTLPGLVATRCGTLASARAYLAGTAFDVVCTAAELPDGAGTSLLDVRDALGLRAPVFVWTPSQGLIPDRERISAAAACFLLDGTDEAAAAAAVGRALGAQEEPGGEEISTSALLEALRLETGAVAHAINNPLTVIAGNAQFLCEMARMGELDPMLARPIEDIEAATQQLSEALGRLALLRQHIADSLGVVDRI